MREPKLREAHKGRAPYKLGKFPDEVILEIAKGIIFTAWSSGPDELKGGVWERIFARAIGAQWRPSNVGLDDVRLENACWSAKAVKAKNPETADKVRLISGRNSLDYSFGISDPRHRDPNEVGADVVRIWNSRVLALKDRFVDCRTIVLLKSDDLSKAAFFEKETCAYDPIEFDWAWNSQNNLVGTAKSDGTHRFTWQPHGSQFTIIESVPKDRIALKLKIPERIKYEEGLKQMGFDNTWVEVIPSSG